MLSLCVLAGKTGSDCVQQGVQRRRPASRRTLTPTFNPFSSMCDVSFFLFVFPSNARPTVKYVKYLCQKHSGSVELKKTTQNPQKSKIIIIKKKKKKKRGAVVFALQLCIHSKQSQAAKGRKALHHFC